MGIQVRRDTLRENVQLVSMGSTTRPAECLSANGKLCLCFMDDSASGLALHSPVIECVVPCSIGITSEISVEMPAEFRRRTVREPDRKLPEADDANPTCTVPLWPALSFASRPRLAVK